MRKGKKTFTHKRSRCHRPFCHRSKAGNNLRATKRKKMKEMNRSSKNNRKDFPHRSELLKNQPIPNNNGYQALKKRADNNSKRIHRDTTDPPSSGKDLVITKVKQDRKTTTHRENDELLDDNDDNTVGMPSDAESFNSTWDCI